MIASHLTLRVDESKGDRQPQEFPRLIAVLVVILALVNVSATVLMARSWASITNGILELEMSVPDHLSETVS